MGRRRSAPATAPATTPRSTPAAARPPRRHRGGVDPTATSCSRSSSRACAWPTTTPTASTSRSPTPPSRRCGPPSGPSPCLRDPAPGSPSSGSARTSSTTRPTCRPCDLRRPAGRRRLDGRHRGAAPGSCRPASRAVAGEHSSRRQHPAAVRAGAQPVHRRRPEAHLDEVLLHPQADAGEGVARLHVAARRLSAPSTRPSSCCTLIQTGKASPAPIVLLDEPGGTFWSGLLDYLRSHVSAQGPHPRRRLLAVLDRPTTSGVAVDELLTFTRNFHSIQPGRTSRNE